MLRIEIQDLMEPFWKKQKIFSSLFILLPLGGTIGKTSCIDFAYLLLPGLQNCDMGQGRLAKCVCVSSFSLRKVFMGLLLLLFLHTGKDSTYFIGFFTSIK